jgi:ABC-type transporter Mla MlaB component
MGRHLLSTSERRFGPSRRVHHLVLAGPVPGAELPALCERVRKLLEREPADLVECDLRAVLRVDLEVVDVLARLQLTARRHGSRLRLQHAPAGLAELLALLGLDDCAALRVQSTRQPEEREEPGRVQEEGDPADSTI